MPAGPGALTKVILTEKTCVNNESLRSNVTANQQEATTCLFTKQGRLK